MKISVIIPVYNSGEYLNNLFKCIDAQTFDDFEVIFVDDGSSDNSFALLQQYADSRENVFASTKQNGGVSDARNFGMAKAKGEYLVFWDADDEISPSFLSEMYSLSQKYSDLLCMSAFVYDLNGEKCEKGISQSECYYTKNQVRELQDLWLYNALWNKIFCAKVVRENNISFTKGMTFGEDLEFIASYAKYVSGYYVINKCLYTYFTRSTNASQRYHKTKLETIKSCYSKITESMDDNLPDYQSELIAFKLYTLNDFIGALWHYCKFYKADKDNKKLIKQTLRIINKDFKGLYKVNIALKMVIKLKSVTVARIYYHFLKKI